MPFKFICAHKHEEASTLMALKVFCSVEKMGSRKRCSLPDLLLSARRRPSKIWRKAVRNGDTWPS